MSLREAVSSAVPQGLAEPEGRQGWVCWGDGSRSFACAPASWVSLDKLPKCPSVPRLPCLDRRWRSHLPFQPGDGVES